MDHSMIKKDIREQLKTAFLNYSLAVIQDRAIPNIEDGLKPVQRRIIYVMHELGLIFDKPHKKAVRIVGDVLGKLHPHSDSSVYDALVGLEQEFKTRYPLIDGHGNYGSLDDPPAAMRYTEARLTPYAETMLRDLDPKVVKFIDNFDGSLQEPTVLPAMLPNILLNGANGIAVGFATSMLPHNLTEVCDALVYLINNEKSTLDDVLKIIQGPDFPTGAILNIPDRKLLYSTGSGSMRMRAQVHIEDWSIVITEFPFQVDKVALLTQIATMAKEKVIDGIINLRDESDSNIRIVIETDGKNSMKGIIEALYLKTKLEASISMKNLVLVNSVPTQLGLLEILTTFLNFRKMIVKKKLSNELEYLKNRTLIVEAIQIALKDIDNVIKIIKQSKNSKEAQVLLKKTFGFTTDQVTAILEIRLSKLLRLENKKCEDELIQLVKRKGEVQELLNNKVSFNKMLIKEIEVLKNTLGDKRRTLIVDNFSAVKYEGKRNHITVFKNKVLNRKETGEGVIYSGVHYVSDVLMLVCDDGNVHYVKSNDCEDIKDIVYCGIKSEKLFCVSESGKLAYVNVKDKNFQVMSLENDDRLVKVLENVEDKQIILLTRMGMALRIDSNDVRLSSYGVKGIKGITLNKGDAVQDVVTIDKEDEIVYITEKGYIKRLPVKYIPLQARGGKGVIACRLNDKTGLFLRSFLKRDIFIKNKDDVKTISINDIPICDRYQVGNYYIYEGVF